MFEDSPAAGRCSLASAFGRTNDDNDETDKGAHPMVYALLNSLANRIVGRPCRRCGGHIASTDPFGVSEGVCSGCRN